MTYPTIHTNGSSKDDLIAALEKANLALHDACNALGEAAPNARDYYPQGPDAYGKARDAHQADLTALHNVMHHIQYLWESIDGQEG